MENDLKLNVLQDFVDMNGGTFKLNVKWYNGKLFIEQDNEHVGGMIQFTQMPLSPTIEKDLKNEVFKNMPGLRRITINNSQILQQKVEQPSLISLINKFEQPVDFELTLNGNRPAVIEMYTLSGIQRYEHDYTYVRALFTTNPYLATVFNGIRIVPYARDIEELGDEVIQTVKEYAQTILSKGNQDEATLQFKVEKAFEISFYLNGQEVTKDIHEMMNKTSEYQTTLDEFGFIAYIAYYQLFEGELNNQVALTDI